MCGRVSVVVVVVVVVAIAHKIEPRTRIKYGEKDVMVQVTAVAIDSNHAQQGLQVLQMLRESE